MGLAGFGVGKWGSGHWDWDFWLWEWEKNVKNKKQMGMGFENCKVGFGKNMSWEMELVLPLQDPLVTQRLSRMSWGATVTSKQF